MTRRLLACAGLTALALLAGCPDNPYEADTWIDKLDEQGEAERAVTELEHIGDPKAIPGLGKLWDKMPKIKSPSETLEDIKGAGETLSNMAKPSTMVTGRMACAVAANGAPDCKAGADRLCQSKGYKEGKSLDSDAVEAVLRAAGHRVKKRVEGPAGLTQREIEVLRLLARGLTTKEMAAQLGVSPKTAGNHIEHIYAKIGAVNRVTASHFAVQNGLLPEEELASPPPEKTRSTGKK